MTIILLIGAMLLIFLGQAMYSMGYCDYHRVDVPTTKKELIKFLFLPYAIGYVKSLENKRENYLDIP
jgi:hypothetical protein|tara:strand:+ start:11790 stop:11990 length:201 start_codon:yes stop_codon:yes gene_type:complete